MTALADEIALADGSPLPGIVQTGAYGLVLDGRGKLLLVRARSGRFYLPGGRLEPFETAERALLREICEECALRARVLYRIAEAVQPIFEGRVRLRASYWRAAIEGAIRNVPEHESLWMSPAEAARALHRESDARMALAAV
jgi:8-oxo-dGTP pyrophosphatase MutT (NUDIX family)